MKRYVRSMVIVALIGAFGLLTFGLAGCAGSLHLEKANPQPYVTGVGFSESPDFETAKQEALTQARRMAAHQLAVDALQFKFIGYDDNAMIKIKYPQGLEAGEIDKVKKLDAVKVMVTVKAKRPDDVLEKMRNLKVVEVKKICTKGLFQDRLELAERMALEQAAREFAEAKYGTSDGVFEGYLTITNMRIKVLDVGVEVDIKVAFNIKNRKKLDNRAKAMVLFETWRRAEQRKMAHLPKFVELFQKAVELYPNPNYYYEFGTYMSHRNEFDKAAKALEKAVELQPNNLDFLQRLRRVYMAMGKDDLAEKIGEKIDQLSEDEGNAREWNGEDAVYEEKYILERDEDKADKHLETTQPKGDSTQEELKQ